MAESEQPQTNPLDGMLERIEGLLHDTQDFERFRLGLGIKLALGMAREIQQGKAPGTETATWVQAWHSEHGAETSDQVVAIAREFLMHPDRLRQAFADRLGMPRDAANR